ncbi:MAG: hypothetical protein LBE56_12670 [Tannerella sp.]|jgi:hypothetical protein|nr:hypothetical protein [Tannerella sp.]
MLNPATSVKFANAVAKLLRLVNLSPSGTDGIPVIAGLAASLNTPEDQLPPIVNPQMDSMFNQYTTTILSNK